MGPKCIPQYLLLPGLILLIGSLPMTDSIPEEQRAPQGAYVLGNEVRNGLGRAANFFQGQMRGYVDQAGRFIHEHINGQQGVDLFADHGFHDHNVGNAGTTARREEDKPARWNVVGRLYRFVKDRFKRWRLMRKMKRAWKNGMPIGEYIRIAREEGVKLKEKFLRKVGAIGAHTAHTDGGAYIQIGDQGHQNAGGHHTRSGRRHRLQRGKDSSTELSSTSSTSGSERAKQQSRRDRFCKKLLATKQASPNSNRSYGWQLTVLNCVFYEGGHAYKMTESDCETNYSGTSYKQTKWEGEEGSIPSKSSLQKSECAYK